MSALILCLIGLGVMGYMAFGRWLALRQVPQILERRWSEHCAAWPLLTEPSDRTRYGAEFRQDAAGFVWAMTFLWLVMIPVESLTTSTRAAIERRDPFLQQEQIEQQRKRITELERELGMR